MLPHADGVDPIRPVHSDIPLVILKAGQSVRLEAHCHKGIGKDHTKYSPCATASYRLLPGLHNFSPLSLIIDRYLLFTTCGRY